MQVPIRKKPPKAKIQFGLSCRKWRLSQRERLAIAATLRLLLLVAASRDFEEQFCRLQRQARQTSEVPVALSALWRSYIGWASWDSSSSRWVWFYCQWVAHHQGEIFHIAPFPSNILPQTAKVPKLTKSEKELFAKPTSCASSLSR